MGDGGSERGKVARNQRAGVRELVTALDPILRNIYRTANSYQLYHELPLPVAERCLPESVRTYVTNGHTVLMAVRSSLLFPVSKVRISSRFGRRTMVC